MRRIDEADIPVHRDGMARGTVQESLNKLLEAEANVVCQNPRQRRRGTSIVSGAASQSPARVIGIAPLSSTRSAGNVVARTEHGGESEVDPAVHIV